jgi:hypothetical protein
MLERNRLQCENAAKHIPVPDFNRAGGDVVCPVCSHKYYDHPQHVPHRWLTVLCDGRHVKL